MTFPLANKHLHGFVDMLYCHFMDMKQVLYIQLQKYYYYCHALDIHVLIVAKSTVVEAPS